MYWAALTLGLVGILVVFTHTAIGLAMVGASFLFLTGKGATS